MNRHEVRGLCRQKGHTRGLYSAGAEYPFEVLLPQVKLELVLRDKNGWNQACGPHPETPSREDGDGKIFL